MGYVLICKRYWVCWWQCVDACSCSIQSSCAEISSSPNHFSFGVLNILKRYNWEDDLCFYHVKRKNKRPKGPHIVHLSTMCHLFDRLARAASYFSDQPKQHKLGRGCWDLSFCQVSLQAVQRFQRKSRRCLSQSEARAAVLFFRSAQKTQTW